MVYCTHCGAKLESTASSPPKFCSQCGQKITDESTSSPATKKRSPLWFRVLLSFAALIIGTLILNALLTEDLTDTVENQLKAVKNKQFTEAYYAFTSKQFQETTSIEAFSAFIKKHPAFSTNQSIHFKERNIHDDIGTLDATLTTTNHQKINVEYKLIKEADQWKILSIRIEDIAAANFSPSPASPRPKDIEPVALNAEHLSKTSMGSLQFEQFILGTLLSPTGIVTAPATRFQTNAGDIYLNLYVKDAAANAKIKVIFEHMETHSTLNPVTTHTPREGQNILSFVFSPPPKGWPKGHYQLKASSGNVKKSSDFFIE